MNPPHDRGPASTEASGAASAATGAAASSAAFTFALAFAFVLASVPPGARAATGSAVGDADGAEIVSSRGMGDEQATPTVLASAEAKARQDNPLTRETKIPTFIGELLFGGDLAPPW